MGSLTGKAAIVGVAESDCGTVPDKTSTELMAQATKRALDDAGLTKQDIDGLFCNGLLGMQPPGWQNTFKYNLYFQIPRPTEAHLLKCMYNMPP